MSLLKDTIRELEATLAREAEFVGSSSNPSTDRSMNLEYLTNVLKQFLLITDLSERSKLASVLCDLLHFKAEEAREIEKIWSAPKGLVGLINEEDLKSEDIHPDLGFNVYLKINNAFFNIKTIDYKEKKIELEIEAEHINSFLFMMQSCQFYNIYIRNNIIHKINSELVSLTKIADVNESKLSVDLEVQELVYYSQGKKNEN